MLCVPIKRADFRALRQASLKGDLVEFRLDLNEPKNLPELIKECRKPIIFKLKTPTDALLSLAPDFIDLDYSHGPEVFASIGRRFPKIRKICSYHDFKQTPDLEPLTGKLKKCPAEIYKIAAMARSTNDALRMLQWVRKYRGVGICMGEFGEITRILAPVFGSPWTSAPLDATQKTAPGQLYLDDLVKTYRYRTLSPRTALYGLIGDFVASSQSHRFHNIALDQLGLDAVYVKMKVAKEELDTFFLRCIDLGFQGLSVTMPLKEAVVPLLDHGRERAINTIAIRGRSILGWNTDGIGALDIIEKRMKVRGKKMVLLGAGGVAAAIAKEAVKRGADLTVLNRNLKRAQTLVEELGGAAYSLSDFERVAKMGYDILVNGTSVGMGGETPVPAAHLLEDRLVMDVISQPSQTPFLMAAEQKRCEVIKGIELFTQQAVEQYCHWFLNSE